MRKAQPAKPIFPVGLLLEGRTALVVGGGRIALQKTHALLQAGVRVELVCPEALPELIALHESGQIHWTQRAFRDEDVRDAVIAYAATDQAVVNQQVLASCRARQVLCCCVDQAWPQGDFITPATFRQQGLVVTVSTGGRSCRHSRLVKETLERHIRLLETTSLLVMGTSHQEVSLEQREALQLSGERLQVVGERLAQIWGIHEFMLLNTCNRIEVIAAVAHVEPVLDLVRMSLGFSALPPEGFYLKTGMEAFEHTACLCAGILSQAQGEKHIVAQVKQALEQAAQQGWAGSIMQEWTDSALHISRHLRQVLPGSDGSRELEDLAMHFLRVQCPSLSSTSPLVVGAGVVGRGMVSRLLNCGLSCQWCYHRRRPDLPVAWEGRVTLVPFASLAASLQQAMVVVFATGGGRHVIEADQVVPGAAPEGQVIVDLGMPRNVSAAAVTRMRGSRYVDLDTLKEWQQHDGQSRDSLHRASRAIVRDHANFCDKLIRSIQGGNPE